LYFSGLLRPRIRDRTDGWMPGTDSCRRTSLAFACHGDGSLVPTATGLRFFGRLGWARLASCRARQLRFFLGWGCRRESATHSPWSALDLVALGCGVVAAEALRLARFPRTWSLRWLDDPAHGRRHAVPLRHAANDADGVHLGEEGVCAQSSTAEARGSHGARVTGGTGPMCRAGLAVHWVAHRGASARCARTIPSGSHSMEGAAAAVVSADAGRRMFNR